ncbi:MAG: serine/threonine protein kinase [Planctomycetota bacterium]|nr:MAG: serine/threonine protein kinase [Planctomycetota bacterium]
MSKDSQFGRIAVEHNFISRRQLEDCFQIRDKLVSLGIQAKTLDQIMLEKGLIDPEERDEILKIMEENGEKTNIQIPGYEVLEQIGVGGMGTVFKAKQVRMDRIVALKVLSFHLSQDQNYVEKFKREAQTLAKLNHKNIVKGIEIGEHNGLFYFAMEFINGQSCNHILAEKKSLSENMVIHIGIQVAEALVHIHNNGIVHCDIKPHNILLDSQGIVKIMDFGLALPVGTRLKKESQQAVGTPHYISPEQAKGVEVIDGRSDIYSLGATLYHLAVGEPPFSGNSPMVVMTKHLTDPVVPPIKRQSGISPSLSGAIMKMMEKKKEDRYQTAQELLQDLIKVEKGESLGLESRGGFKTVKKKVYNKSGSRSAGGRRSSRPSTDSFMPTNKIRNLQARQKHDTISLMIAIGVVFLLLIFGGVKLMHFYQDPGNVSVVNPQNEEMAWQLLDEASTYKRLHPEDMEGAIQRYQKVIQTYPGTEAAKYAEKMLRDEK